MKFSVSKLSDRGRVRSNNEDYAIVTMDRPCAPRKESSGRYSIHGAGTISLVVCDGIGGHAGGEVASAIAGNAAGAHLCGRPHEVGLALEAANAAVWQRAREDRSLAGMGTTATIASVSPDGRMSVGHVGDSRAYLFRDGAIRRLTTDHTAAEELVASGILDRETAEKCAVAHVLQRAVGTSPTVLVDVGTETVRPGDGVLLCTDGLHGVVDERRIAACLSATRGDAHASCETLISAALALGGPDNVSAVVAWVLIPDEPPHPCSAALLRTWPPP